MADRGLVYVLPDKVWFYCRHTGPLVIDSLEGIDRSHTLDDIDAMLTPYDERVHDDETSYRKFLCRMVEVDLKRETIILKDEPYEIGDHTVMQRPRKVKWEGSFAEFNDYHSHIKRIWNGMFAG